MKHCPPPCIIYHLPALVQSAVEVGEVKGQEGNDVGEGGALEKCL